MRVFQTEAKDTKTGLSMVLSECSYNMAMDWLSRELKRYNVTIVAIGSMHIPYELKTIITQTIETGAYMRTFYYDEERGVLLGE